MASNWQDYANVGGFGSALAQCANVNTPRQVTVPERLDEIEKSLYELYSTLSRVEESLVGPRPEKGCGTVQDAAPFIDSQLSRIQRQLSIVHDSANAINRQIARQ